MDINETLDEGISHDLHLDTPIKSDLKETAKWTKFLSILGYVYLSFFVVGIVLSLFTGFSISSIFFLLISLGFGYLIYYIISNLYKFSTKVRIAIDNDNQSALSESFAGLKSYFKTVGIMTAVVLALYIIIFMILIFGGGMAYLSQYF